MNGPTIAPTGYWSADTAYLYHALSPGLAKWLAAMLDKSVPTYDFGCGMGGYLRALADAWHTSLVGFEGDPPRPGLWHVIHKADLTRPANTPGGPSLFTKKGNVLCIEVAEHVPAEHEATLLDTLTAACEKTIVLSWAVRGQPGEGHVNCRNNSEVVPLLEARGFVCDVAATNEGRMAADFLPWFRSTLLVFRRAQ